MQLKSITAIAVLLLVIASLLVSGCTTSNTPTATPTELPTATPTGQATVGSTPSAGSLAADKLAGAIDEKYKSEGYTVNTPFKVTKSGDTITYTGVVTDGQKVLTPKKHNVTVVLTTSRDTAKTAYQASIDEQKANGYVEYLTSNYSSYSYWMGYLGTTSSSNPSTPSVTVTLNQPYSSGLILPGDSNLYLSSGYVKDYYQLNTNLETPA